MAVESADDLAAFLDTDDFGEEISWTVGASTATLAVVANAGTLRIEGMDGPGVLNRQASVLCREADIPTGGAAGDSVSFRSVAHTVKSIEPDGTGMALVRLEQTVAD